MLVDRQTGSMRPLLTGLQTAIDLQPAGGASGPIYVLEFSRSLTTGAPGRVLRLEAEGASPVVIADSIVSPSAIAIDPRTGDLWVSQIFSGKVVRVLAPR